MNGNPDAMKEFEILTCPLAQSNLIEASAGTGKTFAIAGIVVRLLVEKPLCIGEILVVTYTIAATEELRDRIRKAIRKALDAFVRGAGSDPFLAGLVERHPAPEKAVQLLKTALRDFDGASIHTIHGFCQQTLRENAFESMNPFDQTLIADERPLVEEIVQDFWRRRLYDAPIEVAACALERGETPKTLAKLAQKATRVQACCTVTEDPSASMASIAPLRAAFADVCAAWETCRPPCPGGPRPSGPQPDEIQKSRGPGERHGPVRPVRPCRSFLSETRPLHGLGRCGGRKEGGDTSRTSLLSSV